MTDAAATRAEQVDKYVALDALRGVLYALLTWKYR